MKLSTAVLLATLLVAASLADATAAPVFARGYDMAQETGAGQARVSLDQAVAIARRQVPGKVIGAETRERRGRVVHQVKILTPEGTVRVVRVDGESGRVLR